MPRNQTLYRARILRGWSQATLARHIETSTKNVSRWERGETVPSPYYRERLCQLFGMDAQALGLLAIPEPEEEPSVKVNPTIHTGALIDPALPPLLSNSELFVGRKQLLQDLIQQVQPGSLVTLQGLPGVGKTTLLLMLIRQAEILERFYDGVLWVGLGPTPNISHHMARLAHLLDLPTSIFEQEDTANNASQLLRDALSGRHFLIILDDVWAVETVLPFLVGGPGVAYIITTRLPKIAFSLEQSSLCVVPSLSTEESIYLLTTLVAALKNVDNTLLRNVVQLTGGLPLAIMLIGRYLASHSYGGQIRRLEMALNRLADLAYRLRLSIPISTVSSSTQDNNYLRSLSTAISVSDRQLSATARNTLRALSILPTAPAYFSEEAALAVSEVDVEVLDQLVDAGLIEPAENNFYQIHRTVADYAYHHSEDKAPKIRLVQYAHRVSIDHATNVDFLERECATLFAGLDLARKLQMHRELIEGTLALAPFMRQRPFFRDADLYLRKALHASIFLQDRVLCQKILLELATFARLRGDETQFSIYMRIWQTLVDQPADQNHMVYLLTEVSRTIKEDIKTPRLYSI